MKDRGFEKSDEAYGLVRTVLGNCIKFTLLFMHINRTTLFDVNIEIHTD